MNRKTVITMGSGLSALALAATCAPALAYGHHGHHRGDMRLGMLAHAAGLTTDQIHSAFKNDVALKTDFENFKKAKTAVDSCIVAGTCTNEIATYANAEQTLTQEKMTVWQNLFKGAPNKAQAVSLKGQLDQLNAQKHQIMHQVFSSAKSSDSSTPQAPQ